MKGRRKRAYYKELLKLPNVKLVAQNIKSFELIKNAKLITTITGTVGWEGALLGKPVITFGETFFNALSFVKRVHDIETLPQVITEQLENFNYDQEEMVNFLTAVIADSFPMDFFTLWYENDIGKLKENPQIQEFAKRLMEKMGR